MEAMLPAPDVQNFYLKVHGPCIYNIGVNGSFSTSVFDTMAIIADLLSLTFKLTKSDLKKNQVIEKSSST